MFELEKKLQKAQHKNCKFPSSQKYFDLYIASKNWLSTNIFKSANVKVACDGEGFYTDHGIAHYNAIIAKADYFLQFVSKKVSLTHYEIYLFLMSALLHDAGMAHGRAEHGNNCRTVALKMHNCLPYSEFERKTIFSIAESHHGKTIFGSKDTLSILERESEIHGVKFRPALLAALLRFFDEISEDKERAALYHLEAGQLPEESRIHHLYASMINSVNYSNGIVHITYFAKKNILFEKIDLYKDEYVVNSTYIFDWVCSKLKKMNIERQYCSRFMWGFLQLEAIHAKFIISDDDRLEEYKSIGIKCSDSINIEDFESDIIVIEPDYTGEKLHKELV